MKGTVYISWAFGQITIRNIGTNGVVWASKKKFPISQMGIEMEKAKKRAIRMGYEVSA